MIATFRFVLLVLFLCVVALLSAIVTMHFAIHGAEVAIPDFRGMTITEAMRKAAALDLNLSVDNRFYSAEMPAGRVLAQTPLAGTVVRREWRVRVTQSLGPQKAAIPNVIGQPERTATIAIRRMGLDLGSVAHMPVAGAPEGSVIAQNPAPDAAGVERPNMSLLVADYAPPSAQAMVMPDLTGQLFATASAALNRAGLKVAPPIDVPVGIAPLANASIAQAVAAPGTVIAQSPPAGYRADANTPVQLTIAR